MQFGSAGHLDVALVTPHHVIEGLENLEAMLARAVQLFDPSVNLSERWGRRATWPYDQFRVPRRVTQGVVEREVLDLVPGAFTEIGPMGIDHKCVYEDLRGVGCVQDIHSLGRQRPSGGHG